MKFLVCLLSIFVAANCMEVRVMPCKGVESLAKVEDVSIEPCDSEPCVLHKGSSASISFKFTPTAEVTSLKTVVKGKIGMWLPFPLKTDDACKYAGLTCPMKASQQQTYKFSLPVSKYYPSLSVVVRWRLVDQNGATQACFDFPTSLK